MTKLLRPCTEVRIISSKNGAVKVEIRATSVTKKSTEEGLQTHISDLVLWHYWKKTKGDSFGIEDDVLNKTSKAQKTKKKVTTWYYVNCRSFHTAKGTIMESGDLN